MLGSPNIELLVFTTDPRFARRVLGAGAAGVVVDWERRGKSRRQLGEGTEVNEHTPEDLARVRAAAPGARVLCRVDAAGWGSSCRTTPCSPT